MKVDTILRGKGDKVVTIRPETAVAVAARRLRMENIGALVVSSDGESVQGILSERDIVAGLVEHGAGLLDRQVQDLMTREVLTCTPQDSISDIMARMTRSRVRHLPVLDGGRLAGIVSIGDVVKNRLEELQLETSALRDSYFATHAP